MSILPTLSRYSFRKYHASPRDDDTLGTAGLTAGVAGRVGAQGGSSWPDVDGHYQTLVGDLEGRGLPPAEFVLGTAVDAEQLQEDSSDASEYRAPIPELFNTVVLEKAEDDEDADTDDTDTSAADGSDDDSVPGLGIVSGLAGLGAAAGHLLSKASDSDESGGNEGA